MEVGIIKGIIREELDDLGIEGAIVSSDDEFIATICPSIWVGFRSIEDLNLFRINGTTKSGFKIFLEVI
jgi:hypothetical protein